MAKEQLDSIEIKIELCRMLKELDEYLGGHGIQYSIMSGTLLGAVRHGGFIPWDDDIDIAVLRKDYDRLIEILRKNKRIGEELEISGYEVDKTDMPFLKVYNKSIAVKDNLAKDPSELWIDIFPFDNVPDCLPLRKAHFMLCFIIRKLLWSEVGAKSEENRWIKIIYRIMSLVPFSVIVGMYNQLIEINQHKKTELVRILTFPTPKAVYGYKREWYTKLRRYQFGNMKLPGAKDYDAYLKVKYGDYMKMPPTDRRKVHEISRLSLGREMW